MLKNWYQKFFQPIDTLLTFLCAGGITYFLFRFNLSSSLSNEFLLNMTESLIGLLGFVMAFMAIIFSFNDSEKLVYFKKTKSFRTVMDIIVNALFWISFGVIILILREVLNIDASPKVEMFMFLAIVFLVIIKTGRCIWITRRIFNLSIK
jgi:hypothetical protein